MACIKCKEKKVYATGLCRRCYNKKNKDRITEKSREWAKNNKEKMSEYGRQMRDKLLFGGNMQEVYERDNFQCQKCGMSQEQHFVLFNKHLIIHHKDVHGRRHPNPNHDVDNLLTVCIRCHADIHNKLVAEERWGDLLEQDDSEYKYPKIRELVEKKDKELGGIQKAKRAVAKDLDVSFWTIDTKYYERKEKFLYEVN